MARARGRASGPLGEEGLHDAIFQGMEGDHRQPSASDQDAFGGGQHDLAHPCGDLFDRGLAGDGG